MTEKKINITSTALEKGIDLAKDFLDKLIIPSVEETGLLLKDKVTFWKFKNQVKMLNKAKVYCEKNNINPKTISLKLLCPLLEYSALEENEELQDKWSILLTNMVDSEQNIENHVFPYILSQISSPEFILLENVYDDKILRQEKYTNELNSYRQEIPKLKKELNDEIEKVTQQINILKQNNPDFIPHREKWKLDREKRKFENEIKSIDRQEISLVLKINEPQIVPTEELQDFEISNLVRLGVIKYVQKFYANPQTLEIPYENDSDRSGWTSYTNVDLDIEIESDEKYLLTELGELFIKACKLK